jgi:hypothetical protein
VTEDINMRPVPGTAVRIMFGPGIRLTGAELSTARKIIAVARTGKPIFPTHGPANRFDNIFYIEKEGFHDLLREAKIAERFDIAIMSTKGMSVVAARQLLDRLATQIKGKVFPAHDFDYSGFSILGTLGTDGRRYTFETKIDNMVDIGLRLDDIKRLGLELEPYAPDKWKARKLTLRRHGATEEEIEVLEHHRVELNAMTARQFVDFLEAKLTEHGRKGHARCRCDGAARSTANRAAPCQTADRGGARGFGAPGHGDGVAT